MSLHSAYFAQSPSISPSTATGGKMSALKRAHWHRPGNSIFPVLKLTKLLRAQIEIFSHSLLIKIIFKKAWWFQISLLYWSFSSDVVSVKGLKLTGFALPSPWDIETALFMKLFPLVHDQPCASKDPLPVTSEMVLVAQTNLWQSF